MQSDVWQFFEEASSYGREVYTRKGRRGPALAYYMPTLSAIRVLLPCASANRCAPLRSTQELRWIARFRPPAS